MKKYSLAWALDPKHTRFTRVTKPKPFPGRYPTRIAYTGTLIDGKVVSYVGKPTKKALLKFRQFLNSYQFKTVSAVEFDRNGAIARNNTTNPFATCEKSSLRLEYHPFANVKFFLDEGQWRLVQRDGKEVYVFWPDAIPYTAEMCQGHNFMVPANIAPIPPALNDYAVLYWNDGGIYLNAPGTTVPIPNTATGAYTFEQFQQEYPRLRRR